VAGIYGGFATNHAKQPQSSDNGRGKAQQRQEAHKKLLGC